MTWLTWRQFRPQAVTALAALTVFAILLGATGPHVASMYRGSGIAGCRSGACGQLAGNFLLALSGAYTVVFMLGIAAVILAPAVIGVFWGAPLVAREFETGTFRLAWIQSITRSRWMAVKLAVLGLAAITVTEGLSLLYGWWAAPIGQAARLAPGSNFPLGMSPFGLLAFDAHGIVPVGYAAFGFTLGVAAGVLIRRALPAMAVTLLIFAAVQVAVPLAVRPNLFPAERATQSLTANFSGQQQVSPGGEFSLGIDRLDSQPGAWIFSSQAVNAAGQPVSVMPAACVNPSAGDSMPCLASHGIVVAVTYQPTSRYWPIQWTETGIYLALAALLAGFCYWRVGRRLP
ncbi:MAG TPA: ABC transporter permease [Trebonia sp.]|nr:ABC transporter permease [Trebonia sp.]